MAYSRLYRRRWYRPRRRGSPSYRSSSLPSAITELPYSSRLTLLSKGEAAFFDPLQKAIDDKYLIMSKVRLADIVTCSASQWRHGHGGAISQKHLDFVLCDHKTTRFVLAIELDDRSHEEPDRRRRDRFLNEVLAAAGIRLLRIQASANYSVRHLQSCIYKAIARTSDDRLPCRR